jgi:hypothetical protein
MKSLGLVFSLLIIMLFIAACDTGGASPSGSDEVGTMVQQYLQARVDSDEAKLREMTCAAQEVSIPVHASSFRGREGKLNGVTCTFDGTSTVSCTGTIDVTYDGEVKQLPISKAAVTQEDGIWKWCGEAE